MMGMSPAEVDRTSFWKFTAAWNGYVAANTPDNGKMTESEAAVIFDWLAAPTTQLPSLPMPNFMWDGGALTVR